MAASDRTGAHGRAPLGRRALAETLLAGIVIPAHPLALTDERRLDERRQVALTRYYADAGAGGVAVGVHTTQFAIRSVGLFEPVLRLAAGAADEHEQRTGRHLVRVAGAVGATPQAVAEAVLARGLRYDAVLLSLAALPNASSAELLAHCRAIAEVIPLFGFYLQPAVGGRILDHAFWRGFLEIENVVAIKIAPFNRYQTLDVVRALGKSGRVGEVALYTGNDDAIVLDLLADFVPPAGGAEPARPPVRFSGGLLGQWAAWTRRAVELLERVKECRTSGGSGALDLLALGQRLTDANGALFDVRNAFAGCIAGIGEVLRRQGLLANRLCLDPHEGLSPGQSEEIDRVTAAYPELMDDAFVAEHLDRWLR